MTESNESSQAASIKDTAIAGQVGQAGHNLIQAQGEHTVVIDGDGNVIEYNKITQIIGSEVKVPELKSNSPYKGLKKFEPDDAPLFFGRNQFCDRLVTELEQTNFILLLGASGSGKSSVVRAGLMPRLKQAYVNQFASLLLVPDQDPFEALYGSLLGGGYPQAQAQLARQGTAETLSQVVQTLKPPQAFWLIFIDQFEELFTVSEAEKRDRFIASLIKLSQAAPPLVKVVATMRADFLDRLSPYPKLVTLTDLHRPLLAEMQADELRQAIEQPAAHHGVGFETGLVEKIIQDVQGQAGGLPLLQYTLDLLWEAAVQDGGIHDGMLSGSAYDRLGGVRGALQKRVDEIYDGLSSAEQLAAQRIFLRLVEIGGSEASGAGWKPVRRRADRGAFSGEQEEAVLALLIEKRLLVSDAPVEGAGQAGGQGATVEIAHEILLTSWNKLKGWIEQNREDIALRNRLNDDVRQWKAEQPDDELWSGTKLGRVVDLKDKPAFAQALGGFSPEALAFIEASVGRRDRLEQEKEAQRQRELEQERKARKVAQRITVGASLAGVAMAGLGVFSAIQVRQTEIEQIRTSVTLSKAQLANNQTLDATVESIRAEVLLRKSFWLRVRANSEVKTAVLGQLLQMANTGQERNRWEGANGVVFSSDGTKLTTVGDYGTARLWDTSGKPLAELKGQQGRIRSVVFSSDGTKLATLGDNDTVRVWDSTGTPLAELKGQQGSARSVVFSPDGTQLATAGDDGTAWVWDSAGNQLAALKGHRGSVYSVVFSPDGTKLATTGEDGTARLWDSDGNQLAELKGHQGSVRSVVFSPDGTKLATTEEDGTAHLWDSDGNQLAELKGHQGSVWSVVFSPDGTKLATTGEDGTAHLWDSDGNQLAELKGHQGSVRSVVFSPDGTKLATTGEDGTARLWDSDGNQLAELKGHQGSVWSVVFSPDGTQIVTSGGDDTVRTWDVLGKPLAEGKLLAELNGHQGPINSVALSPDGTNLVTLGDDGTARLWDSDGNQLAELKGHQGPVLSVAFSPDGTQMATSGNDGTARLWNSAGKQLAELKGHRGPVLSVVFSSDGTQLATSGDDGTARLWGTSGKQLAELKGHQGPILSVVFSPDATQLATTGDDGIARLWDTSGKQLAELKNRQGRVSSIVFSRTKLATGGDDGTVRLWDRAGNPIGHIRFLPESVMSAALFSPDGTQLAASGDNGAVSLLDISGAQSAEIKGHQGSVLSMVFSSDGTQLATSGDDGTVHLWDRAGKPLAELNGHQGPINSMAFSPDGTQLATGGADGTTRLWQFGSADQLLAKNCDWVRAFLQNAQSTEKDRHLCDGIGTMPQAQPSPASSPPANPFSAAINQATQAANFAQSAKTPEQWRTVANHWQQAITHLQAIPPTDPNHAIAQQKIGEYQKNLQYAQQQSTSSR